MIEMKQPAPAYALSIRYDDSMRNLINVLKGGQLIV